ncbi:Beta-galactosidase 8 [Platanthera zijinensis]|uniref:Beta-galactosidase 8 n=1 Tax=Platanthera zijinensis TaxID=2320716 RepID=A0AAP0C0J0_9ASPA
MKDASDDDADVDRETLVHPHLGRKKVCLGIENEYGNVEWAYGAAAKPYVNWAASMAVSLETGMPWLQQAYDFTPSSLGRSAPHRPPRDDFPTTDPTEEDMYEDEYDDDVELNMYRVQGTLREWVTRDEEFVLSMCPSIMGRGDLKRWGRVLSSTGA